MSDLFLGEDHSNTNLIAASKPMLRKYKIETTYKQDTIYIAGVC